MLLCYDSAISVDAKGKYSKVGESTEAALKVLVEKMDFFGARGQVCRGFEKKYERVATLEFDRDRKSMSVIVKEISSGKTFLFVKGAPESILGALCKIAAKFPWNKKLKNTGRKR